MPKYEVTVSTTTERVYVIEAQSEAEARELMFKRTPPEPYSETENLPEITDVSEVVK